jgi:hypothetical protein
MVQDSYSKLSSNTITDPTAPFHYYEIHEQQYKNIVIM